MSNRPLTSTFNSVKFLNTYCRKTTVHAARQFSSTPSLGVRAVFAETENGELNAILNTIQEKIIFPAYLPEKQRKVVFDPKMRSYLEQNPVVIEVEGLEHKFTTIDRFKGIVNSKVALNQALGKMQTSEDWDNLGTLLAGYKKAGIKLNARHWGKIVRVAGETGSIYAIVECAKQANETGFKLTNHEVVVRTLVCINDKITDSNRGLAETRQALNWTSSVFDLLQRPEHKISAQATTREKLHFSKAVRGLLLFARTSALKAKQEKGHPVDQDLVLLQDEVDLITSLWADSLGRNISELDDFAKLNPLFQTPDSNKDTKLNETLSGSGYVRLLAQNIKGLSLAQELLPNPPPTLIQVGTALEQHLHQFLSGNKKTEEWTKEYEKIVGKSKSV